MFTWLKFGKKPLSSKKEGLLMQDYNFTQDPISGFVGFMDLDAVLKAIQGDAGNPDFDVTIFPFFNIHSDSTHYMLDMSIPGYADADLSISVVDSVLHVKGTKVDAYAGVNSVFNGDLTPLTFSKSFRLYDTLVIDTIKHVNGILSIKFVKMLPDPSREGLYPVEFTRGVTPLIVPPAPVVPPVVVDPTPVANTVVDPVVVDPVVANTDPVVVEPTPVVDPAPVVVDPAPVANT